MRAVVLLSLVLATRTAAAEPVAAVAAHESTETDPRGVTRTTRYTDRIFRDGDQVWIARVLPRAERRVTSPRELDLEMLARWYTRTPHGTRVALVSVANKIVVDLDGPAIETLGLAARWEDVVAATRADPHAGVTITRVPAPTPPWAAVTADFRHIELSDLED